MACAVVSYIRARQQLPGWGKKLLKKKSRARRVADMGCKIDDGRELRKARAHVFPRNEVCANLRSPFTRSCDGGAASLSGRCLRSKARASGR
jgi:hypothetical protein